MNSKRNDISNRYLVALTKHIGQAAKPGMGPAGELGSQAIAVGLSVLDMARIHDRSLHQLVASNGTSAGEIAMLRRAGKFLADAIVPFQITHRDALKAKLSSIRTNRRCSRQETDLAVTSQKLEQEIQRRKAAEEALKKSELHSSQLLAQSHDMQDRLRHLSHQILLAQEEERKEISRELHDQIAQTLTGINVHLAALKQEAVSNTADLAKRILSTQRLVEQSVNIVHRFARELRPTVLDDLGLIPAIQSHLKEFTKRTHVPVVFTAFPGVERLGGDERTVLFRVVQAALTNIAQHAKASEVTLNIRKLRTDICLEINDNGKSFDVERVLFAKRHKRLGVLGMRERVEMVGGSFTIKSAPGKGTTILARIPFRSSAKVS